VLEGVRRFLDIGEDLERQFPALLIRLGEMYDLRALGFGHFGGIVGVLRWWRLRSEKARVDFATSRKTERGILANHRLVQPRLTSAVDLHHRQTLDSPDLTSVRSRWYTDDIDMLDFMDSVQNAFYEASHWNVDNSYGALNASARGTSREMSRSRRHTDQLQHCSTFKYREGCACRFPLLPPRTSRHHTH
jgi:hypothetical protein